MPRVTIDDPRFVRALAHPLRIRILAMLQERPASPVVLSQRLDASLGRVAHHFRVLHELGLLELVETRQRRGATEHIYRAHELPRFSDEAWGRLDSADKQRVLAAVLGQISAYVGGSAVAGGFDRADVNLSRMPLRLDEQGWTQLAEASKRWLAEADSIQTEARKRTGNAESIGHVDAGLVLLLFEALPFSERGAGRVIQDR